MYIYIYMYLYRYAFPGLIFVSLNPNHLVEAPPPTGPKKPDIQPGPGRGQAGGGEQWLVMVSSRWLL